jgi:hypothetical protein
MAMALLVFAALYKPVSSAWRRLLNLDVGDLLI